MRTCLQCGASSTDEHFFNVNTCYDCVMRNVDDDISAPYLNLLSNTKRCPICRQFKLISEFDLNPKNADGYEPHCIECSSIEKKRVPKVHKADRSLMSVLSLDNVGKVEIKPNANSSVYFLTLQNAVVYVGQSSNVYQRVHAHKCDKEFDGVSFINVNAKALNVTESAFIYLFRPFYNGARAHVPVRMGYEQVVFVLKHYGIHVFNRRPIDGSKASFTWDFKYKEKTRHLNQFVYQGTVSDYTNKGGLL